MSKHSFKKVISSRDILVIAFGAMIGWGWVVATGGWIQEAGAAGTVLGFVLGGVMIYFVGLTYAELTPAMPKAGGEHVFSYRAFGPTGSFICTWALILSYIGVVCFEAVSLPAIIQGMFPGFNQIYLYTIAGADVYLTGILLSLGFNALIIAINIIGIKVASAFQTILTLAIVVAGAALVIASFINGSASNLGEQWLVGSGIDSVKNIISVAVVAPFFLFGFDVIPQVAEEINVPLKKIGRILLMSIICAVLFYGLVVLAVGNALSPQEIVDSMKGSGLVTASAMAKVFHSDAMSRVLILGGLCGVVTSWNSFLIGGSRAIYAMAESRMIPNRYARLHKKYRTPVNAVVLIGVISGIAPFFGRTMLVWISDAASFACCFAYFMVSLSFLVLRKKEPELKRPFKIRNFRFIGTAAVLLSGILVLMNLIPGSGGTLKPQEAAIVGGWTVLGIAFYAVCKHEYQEKFGRSE